MKEQDDLFTKTFIVNDKAKEQIVRLGKIEEYDEAGRLVQVTNFSSHGEKEFYEVFREYDELGNLIHSKASDGTEWWWEYDKDGRKIRYWQNAYPMEERWKYDEKRNGIYHKYFDGKKTSEAWKEYDEQGHEIHAKESNGIEWWCEYNEKGNKIHEWDSNGPAHEHWYEYEHYENGKPKKIIEYNVI